MNDIYIDGLGFWAEQLPGWQIAAPILRSGAVLPSERAPRPGPKRLAPAERRRAPDSVCLALQVADEAVAASGLDGALLPCVFSSTHGDLPLTDYMCDTVAGDAANLSPTRFHNSVHNAPAGYWTMAAGAREASSALTAFQYSFGAGLLEAMIQCLCESRPVLYVAYDVGAKGALAQVTRSEGMLAVAMVLSPVRTPATLHAIGWQSGEKPNPARLSGPVTGLAGNAMADCLPLFEALARKESKTIDLAAGVNLALRLSLQDES